MIGFSTNDNAPAHKALFFKQFMAQKLISEMENPPCSPYLVPMTSGCFQK
jgi:hypothetical protein